MIRQPKRDERRQIIPLIELIMQDMGLPILEHTSPEMLYAMLEEAMLDDQFRYGLKNTLVYIHEGKIAGAIFGYHGHLEDAIDDPFHRLYEDYNTPHQIPLYEDKETMPGEWYIDILAVYPEYRRLGIGRKLLVEVENLARQQGATKIALNCEKDNTKAYQLYEKLGYTPESERILSGHPYYHMTKTLLKIPLWTKSFKERIVKM